MIVSKLFKKIPSDYKILFYDPWLETLEEMDNGYYENYKDHDVTDIEVNVIDKKVTLYLFVEDFEANRAEKKKKEFIENFKKYVSNSQRLLNLIEKDSNKLVNDIKKIDDLSYL